MRNPYFQNFSLDKLISSDTELSASDKEVLELIQKLLEPWDTFGKLL
jgi:hypothetical protein